jgi:TonB family protein
VEPARVFVDAVVMKGRTKGAKTVQVRYGADDITNWFFGHLVELLEAKGRALPSGFEERQALGQELAGDSSCNAPVASDRKGAVKPPKRFSAPKPIYPAADLENKRKAVVEVEGILAEDGAMHAVRSVASENDQRMIRAALDAVSLWRYEPARTGPCPVTSRMTVSVDFHPR